MDVESSVDALIDVAFALDGTHLPRDHGLLLAHALTEHLPWLAAETLAGIHPVKVVPGYGVRGLLSQRARLRLRVPRAREAALATLEGRTLSVGGCTLHLGESRSRELLPHGTLFAPIVSAESPDEASFMQALAGTLRQLELDAHSVCGRRQQFAVVGGRVTGFSLMLHGLSAADSLRVQCVGIGPHRLLGCGIFVPHRSAAAVGA
jgi:CRISPR-associated protein Cas6